MQGTTAVDRPGDVLEWWAGITWRSVITGFVMAVVMCGANSYLTLKVGIIEEGPIISALIFIAIFAASQKRVTTTEAVIVATMGSAGGSYGFLANLFAAYKMVGIQLTTTQMMLFSLSTGLFSILMAIPFYKMFVVNEPCKWPVGAVCADIIASTTASRDRTQGAIILWFTLLFFGILLLQGRTWMPEDTTFFTIGTVGIGLAWSPFILSAGYMVGMRTSIGFLVGSGILIFIAKWTPVPATPHKFFWPGIAFLIVGGMTKLIMNWQITVASIKSLARIKQGSVADEILSGRVLGGLCLASAGFVVLVMNKWFGVPIWQGVLFVTIGAVLLNMISVRAMADTTFNPTRAMGVVLQGVGFVVGGVDKLINLTCAGVVCGGSNQTGILCQDLKTGRMLGVNPRLQVALQSAVLPVIAVVCVWVFRFLEKTQDLSINTDKLAAPVAKAWAGFTLLIQGGTLPEHTVTLMIVFGTLGLLLTVLEGIPALVKYIPGTTGIGIGMVIAVPMSLDFFVGAVVFFAIAKAFKVNDTVLNSVAAAGILGEAAGGLLGAALKSMNVFGFSG